MKHPSVTQILLISPALVFLFSNVSLLVRFQPKNLPLSFTHPSPLPPTTGASEGIMATALLPVEATSLVLANNKDNFVYVCMIVVSQCSGLHNMFLTCHDKCVVSRKVCSFFSLLFGGSFFQFFDSLV